MILQDIALVRSNLLWSNTVESQEDQTSKEALHVSDYIKNLNHKISEVQIRVKQSLERQHYLQLLYWSVCQNAHSLPEKKTLEELYRQEVVRKQIEQIENEQKMQKQRVAELDETLVSEEHSLRNIHRQLIDRQCVKEQLVSQIETLFDDKENQLSEQEIKERIDRLHQAQYNQAQALQVIHSSTHSEEERLQNYRSQLSDIEKAKNQIRLKLRDQLSANPLDHFFVSVKLGQETNRQLVDSLQNDLEDIEARVVQTDKELASALQMIPLIQDQQNGNLESVSSIEESRLSIIKYQEVVQNEIEWIGGIRSRGGLALSQPQIQIKPSSPPKLISEILPTALKQEDISSFWLFTKQTAQRIETLIEGLFKTLLQIHQLVLKGSQWVAAKLNPYAAYSIIRIQRFTLTALNPLYQSP